MTPTTIPPRTAKQIGQPFNNNGVWIAMFQHPGEPPYPVEVAGPDPIIVKGEMQ